MAFRRSQRGVAAVEFGILIIPLTLMLFGLAEYGRAIYQYNTLVKSVRDATRYLSTVSPGEVNEFGVNEWDRARCLARHGNQTCSGPLLVPGLTAEMVAICDATNCTATHSVVDTTEVAVNLVTVTIRGFQFSSLINFPVGGVSVGAPDIAFGDISNTMRQAL